MDFMEGETGSCSETSVTFDVDRFEEVTIKVEEGVYVKDEIPEAASYPSIKTEHEVRLRGVCEVMAAHAFRPFIASRKKL
jgi:hypothetical protein